MPARDTGVTAAPVLIAKPEIEIGQRATDRDMPDGEGRRGEIAGLLIERLEHGQFLGAKGRDVDRRGMRALALVAQQEQEIEKPVTERLPPQRRHALLTISRHELAPRVQRIEIFADDRRIVEYSSVVEHEGRDF